MSAEKNRKNDLFRGRGAQLNPENRFSKFQFSTEHVEGLDEDALSDEKTEIIFTHPKTIVNKIDSPDIGLAYSMNPYQGCEHGCIYCYARNTHEYWGYSPGLDFERKIIVKKDAAEILKKEFSKKNWDPQPIMLSGNTDCYQPIEKKLEITRSILKVCLQFKHPVALITKNALILRDLDLLNELAALQLVHVMISITGTDEKIRMMLEPRTSTYKNRFEVLKKLTENNIPCGIMMAPVVPGLNIQEIPVVMKRAAENGATSAGYTIVRLNGAIGPLFKDWLFHHHPDRAAKIWNQICECHGGDVQDSVFGRRIKGEGKVADSIKQLFSVSKRRYFTNENPEKVLRRDLFDYTAANPQTRLDFGE